MVRDAYYLALDPGTHTGWATWDEQGTIITMGTTHSDDELIEFLDSLPSTIKVVIYEDFTLWEHKAVQQRGSKMPASKAIGIIKTFAKKWKAKIVSQSPNIKSTAEKWTGVSTKRMAKAKTHVLDAFNHGEYHLIRNNIKPIKIKGIN